MSRKPGLPDYITISTDGTSVTASVAPPDGGTGLTAEVHADMGGVDVSSGVNSGNSSVTLSGDVTAAEGGGYNVTGQQVDITAKGPMGTEVGITLTPNGTRAHPNDPYAPPIPAVKVDLTIGTEVVSYEITIAERFTMDDLFDPERGGIASEGLAGEAYRVLRHRDRTIMETLADAIGGDYQSARSTRRPTDPLVLDLDGDGIETIAADGAVWFDHEGNEVRRGTGWIGGDDGMLVLDRNENGTIDDGTELFGDHTPGAELAAGQTSPVSAGIRALTYLDTNADGKFSSEDESFGLVRVWRDINQDGYSQAEELFTLDELNIASINLQPASTTNVNLGNGNEVDSFGTYVRADGTQGTFADMLLGSNNYYREFTDAIELTEAAKQFANVSGSGMVRDLGEAISLDASIAGLILENGLDTTREEMLASMDDVLRAWGATSTMKSSAERLFNGGAGEYTTLSVNGRRSDGTLVDLTSILSVLEKFNGDLFFTGGANGQALMLNNLGWSPVRVDGHFELTATLESGATELLLSSYSALRDHLYASLVLDTRLADYLAEISLRFNEHGEVVFAMEDAVAKVHQTLAVEGFGSALDDLYDLRLAGEGMFTEWDWVDVLIGLGETEGMSAEFRTQAQRLFGAKFGSDLVGGSGADLLLGTSGNDVLTGNEGNDRLVGGEGNDTLAAGNGLGQLLQGGTGDDVLSVGYSANGTIFEGGTGNDMLHGSYNSDTYRFNLGDGHDTIVEVGTYTAAVDTLQFGEGIAAGDIQVLRQGQDVVLALANGADSVRLKNWLTSGGAEDSGSRIERIMFVDGTMWTPATLHSMGLTTLGTDSNDSLTGWDGKDVLVGGDGNDSLYAANGSDQLLQGGAGDDVLSVNLSYSDRNTFEGGIGNDTLNGSYNNDTYRFNLGDGHDTIVEVGTYTGAVDTLQFGEGIVAGDIQVLKQGQDVVLALANGTDSVRLKNWLTSGGAEDSGSRIEQITFTDGTVWTPETLRSIGLTTQGTGGDDALTGWAGNDILLGGEGNDRIDGDYGSNRLVGGAGDDVLWVNLSYSDRNTFEGGTGNDTLHGSYNNDTYRFNLGDGHDTIVEVGANSGTVDVLEFGADIAASDIQVVKEGRDVVLKLAGGSDSVRLKDWLSDAGAEVAGHGIEKITFVDGTIWTPATLRSMGLTTLGTDGSDSLTGWDGKDVLVGGDGNDSLYAANGSDQLLLGGAGDDVLSVNVSYSDRNTFEGGSGNDTLNGSYFNDTYRFNLGDGHDTIVELSANSGTVDVLEFGEGIDVTSLARARSGNDLVLHVEDDSVTIRDWYVSSYKQVETIRFAGGAEVKSSEVELLIAAMAVSTEQTGISALPSSLENESSKLTLAASL